MLILLDIFQISQDLRRLKRFNAEEALEYGLIDRIIRPPVVKSDKPRTEAASLDQILS